MIALSLSYVVVAAAILLAGATLVVFRQPLPALHVLLDLFLAAGLLRLSADASWAALAVTAGVVVLRRVTTHSLETADSARGATPGVARVRRPVRP